MSSSDVSTPVMHNRYFAECPHCGHDIDQSLPKSQVGDDTQSVRISCVECEGTVFATRGSSSPTGRTAIQFRGRGVIERRIEDQRGADNGCQ